MCNCFKLGDKVRLKPREECNGDYPYDEASINREGVIVENYPSNSWHGFEVRWNGQTAIHRYSLCDNFELTPKHKPLFPKSRFSLLELE